MKLIIFAGPPTCGKTTVIRQVIRRMVKKDLKTAYIKIDVLYADEDEVIAKEFGIPTPLHKEIYFQLQNGDRGLNEKKQNIQ